MWRITLATLVLLVVAHPAVAAERLVVLQARNGPPVAWTMTPGGADRRTVWTLATSPNAPYFDTQVVAPNGRDIAFSSSARFAATVAAYVNETRVADVRSEAYEGAQAVYSRDGTRLAAVLGTHVWLIALPAGTITDLGRVPGLDIEGAFIDAPVWSPDGTRLAFLDYGHTKIVILPVDGSPATTMPWLGGTDGGTIHSITWTPASDALAVGADNLYRLAVPSGARTLLATGSATDIDYAPDGTRLSFLRYPTTAFGHVGRLTLLDADGANAVELGGISRAVWSPDSQRIAYTNTDGVYVASRSGAQPRRVTGGAVKMIGVAAWLPNAITPAPDTTAPVANRANVAILRDRKAIEGGFFDGFRSTDLRSAQVSIVRHTPAGRCQGLTTRGFRTMSCPKARRAFIKARIVRGASGALWRLDVRFGGGHYAIRVKGRDLAGNVNANPRVMSV